jgi:hypothetical protein
LCWFVLDSLLVCVTKQTPTSTTVTTRSIHPFVFVCVTTKQQQQLLLQQEQLTKLQRCRRRLVQSSIHWSIHLFWFVLHCVGLCYKTNTNINYCYNKIHPSICVGLCYNKTTTTTTVTTRTAY